MDDPHIGQATIEIKHEFVSLHRNGRGQAPVLRTPSTIEPPGFARAPAAFASRSSASIMRPLRSARHVQGFNGTASFAAARAAAIGTGALERLVSAVLVEIDDKWAADSKAHMNWECQDA
jgi:hypothetical protein